MKFPSWPNPSGYRDIDLGLARVEELLSRLKNPQLKLPPTIHIAGTNGKGSTQAFLRAIFNENGLQVHSYISPHLVDFNERIILADQQISDEFLNEVLEECRTAAEQSPQIAVTFFEGITVAAFLAFSRIKADVLLLETGMGGRLDATNVLPKVLASIITPISFDHEEFLGNSLAKIAFEKAGIIKKDCPVIVGRQETEALEAIEKVAKEKNSLVKVLNKDFFISDHKLIFLGQEFSLKNLSLTGKHQMDNAALATVAALSSGLIKSDSKIISALAKASWQARLQKIISGKFAKIIPQNCELFLDGSHNLQGATTVKEFLKSKNKGQKKFVIFSMLKDKNCVGFLKTIASEVDELIALTIPDETKSFKGYEIKEIADKIGIKTKIAKNFDEAFDLIKCNEPYLVLVCGSLYLAGNFLTENI